MAQQPLLDQHLLISEASRSHSNTPHSVWLYWRRDRQVAGTSTRQNSTFTRDRHPCPGGIRTYYPSKRAAACPRLRPRVHWDRYSIVILKFDDSQQFQLEVHWFLWSVRNMHTNICPFLRDPKRSRAHGSCDVRHVGRCTILNVKYNFNIIIM
jgi:hypothetical protein